jgi:maltose phosphorylase
MDPHNDQLTKKWLGPVLRSHTSNKLMCCSAFSFFEEHFSKEVETQLEFYESFTVHESSLSPCVHSIQAASLDKMDVILLLKNIRLDDYNKEVEEAVTSPLWLEPDEYC